MIKNFIYLDEDKMYSLSSQLFEGVTEYVLNESFAGKDESEDQKGPVGSGKILGDILRSSERKTEKKFLNDYSFTIFEKKLIEDGRVSIVTPTSPAPPQEKKSFIKVSSKATFNDIISIISTLKNFNTIGKALTHLTNFAAISEARDQFSKNIGSTGGKGAKNRTRTQLKALTDISALAAQSGLQHDQKFLDDMVLLLDYGFQNQLEVQMSNAEMVYSANLNRSFLREPEDLVIRKYSRRTEIEFTLFGIVTQHEGNKSDNAEDVEQNGGMKRALMNLVAQLGNVEATFTGRLDNETIIDPIALYTEL